jgi:hypothetical protein
MRPLAAALVWDAVVDLEGGLPLEVEILLDSFVGNQIGFDEALGD